MEGLNSPRKSMGDPWTSSDVLSLRSFPGTSILRLPRKKYGRGTCSCTDGEVHRDFFAFQKQIVAPCYQDAKDIPEIKICWNAENLWECKLPKKLTGSDSRKTFYDLKTIGDANKVLFEGTFWFPRLIARDKAGPKHGSAGIAVLRLLANLGSPQGKEHIGQLCAMKIHKGSISKLRNILATVDGLLMQLSLCFPGELEFNNWSRIDQIVSCLITNLVTDYFRDKSQDLTRLSTFEKLKKLRKAIKMEGFSPIGDLSTIDIPREISFIKVALDLIGKGNRPLDIYRVSILCQTRASGVPPRSVYFKTLLKIKSVLQEPSDKAVYQSYGAIIGTCVSSIHVKVLENLGSDSKREAFWTNCLEKAKISLSDSGEFFTNSESGGKLEAARKILSLGKPIERTNLFNGDVLDTIVPSDTGQGEYLFHWACLQFADRDTVYDRNVMSVRISLVAELGKYRAITVSHLAHAVLLHVLSHVLLEYLRAVPSSESGVKAANHAWNFFKRLSHKNPSANFIFGDKDVYLFSTDWEQATDYCDHTVAMAIITSLCTTLGIPEWYRETVTFALCAPRQVEFIDPENKTLECFFTSRGELMGDPVVKPILHYYHLIGREIALQQLHASLKER